MIPILLVNSRAVSAAIKRCIFASIWFNLDCISYLEMTPSFSRYFSQLIISCLRCWDIVSRIGWLASGPGQTSARPSRIFMCISLFSCSIPKRATWFQSKHIRSVSSKKRPFSFSYLPSNTLLIGCTGPH